MALPQCCGAGTACSRANLLSHLPGSIAGSQPLGEMFIYEDKICVGLFSLTM